MADQHEGIIAQGHGLDLGVIQRAGHTDISLAVKNHFQDLNRRPRAQTDHHFRIGRLVVLHHVGQKISANRKSRGDIQSAARGWLQLMDGLTGQSHVAKELFRMRAECFSGGGEGEVGMGAREELHAERILQSANARAHGRLADAQGVGGAMESTVCDDCQKRFHLVNFHRDLANRRYSMPGPPRPQEHREGLPPVSGRLY